MAALTRSRSAGGRRAARPEQTPGESSGPAPRTAASPVPSVNLLSPWVFESLQARTLRRRFTAGAAGLAVLVGLGWTGQHLRLLQAEHELRGEQAVTTGLTEQTSQLAPVRAFVGAVERQKATVQETMLGEVYFSAVLAGLDRATPSGVDLESVAVALPEPVSGTAAPAAPTPTADGTTPATSAAPDAPADPDDPAAKAAALRATFASAPCPGPDPFRTTVVVGCVTLSGTAATREQVGALVIRLGASDLFVEPFVSTTTTSGSDPVAFSGSVGLSAAVYSGRYDDLEALLGKETD